jgi:hypothetical protein
MTARYASILLSLACLWSVVAATHLAADVVPGQIADFEDGTTAGWVHGSPNPDEPRVVEDGGPDGAGDAYVEVSSNGLDFAGSKLIMFNDAEQWTGSYLGDSGTDPVVSLEMDLINLGQEPLRMWFSFDGELATAETESFELAPGSGWQQASFSLLPENMTSDGDILQVLENVLRVWFFHNDDFPIHPAPPLVAVLGMDNLTAVGMPVEVLPGDYSGNGLVEQADLDLVLGNWGADANDVPATWINDPPEGFVDQAELDKVLGNWGRMSAGRSGGAGVPEPATWVLLTIAGGCVPCLMARRRLGS